MGASWDRERGANQRAWPAPSAQLDQLGVYRLDAILVPGDGVRIVVAQVLVLGQEVHMATACQVQMICRHLGEVQHPAVIGGVEVAKLAIPTSGLKGDADLQSFGSRGRQRNLGVGWSSGACLGGASGVSPPRRASGGITC